MKNDNTALDYMLKYLTKEEQESDAMLNFCKEALAQHGDDVPIRHLIQKLLLHLCKTRDYGLFEVCMNLNRGKVMEFSREFVYFNTLGDAAINLDGELHEPIGKKTRGDMYDERNNEGSPFLDLVNVYDSAHDDNKPCYKDPRLFTLYEYISCFTEAWLALPKFKVVVPVPRFVRCPKQETNNTWWRKFMISVIRLHVADPPPLDVLECSTDDELKAIAHINLMQSHTTPEWITKLMNSNSYNTVVNRESVLDDLDLEDDNDDIDLNDSQLDELGLGGLGPEGPDQDNVDDDDPEDTAFANEAGANSFDRKREKDFLCESWNSVTGSNFRTALGMHDATGDAEEQPLRLEQLSEKQREVVQLLLSEFIKIFDSRQANLADPRVPVHQFGLEIAGAAGTGKTAILRCFKEQVKRYLASNDSHLSVEDVLKFAAPTGTAATLLPRPTSTLHAALSIPTRYDDKKGLPALTVPQLKRLQEDWRHVVMLFIDESSFIGLKTASKIQQRLNEIADGLVDPTTRAPFGGMSMVLIGDPKQLSPVKDVPIYRPPIANRTQRFEIACSEAYFKLFTKVVVLEKIHRQDGDETYKGILQALVDGNFQEHHWKELSKRHALPDPEGSAFKRSAILLSAYKRDFHKHNVESINRLKASKLLVTSVNLPPVGAATPIGTAGQLPRDLLVARGMRVMMTTNISVTHGLTNGAIGTVVAIVFCSDDDVFPEVLVQFDGYTGPSCLPNVRHVYPVVALERSYSVGKNRFSRTMLPLVPAYGMSIHKSQGQTLKKVILNLGSSEFADGLTYTALSRVARLEDMLFDTGCMPDLLRIQNVAKRPGFMAQQAELDRKKRLAATTEMALDQMLFEDPPAVAVVAAPPIVQPDSPVPNFSLNLPSQRDMGLGSGDFLVTPSLSPVGSSPDEQGFHLFSDSDESL